MACALIFLGYATLSLGSVTKYPNTIGISFDPVYARHLGLNPPDALTTLLKDLDFKYLRLSIHWDEFQKDNSDQENFSTYDELLKISAKHNAKVILAIGQKTPRWPECHLPDWAKKLSAPDKNIALQKYIQTVVNHYKNNPAVEFWQVENEPFFPFGDCPAFSAEQLRQEIDLVRQLDPAHPTIIGDSGELSSWRKTVHAADYFGTTMYRLVWNKHFGYFNYDWLPAAFYRAKLMIYGRDPKTAFILELQGEPWVPNGDATKTPLEEQYKSLSLEQLKKNVDYASRVGFARSYLWGAEWWLWLKNQGNPSLYDYIKTLPKNGG